MRPRSVYVFALALFSGGCSSRGSSSDPSSTEVSVGLGGGAASSDPSAGGGENDPTDAGSAGVSVTGGGGCPARADAAPCAAPPSGFGLATAPPNAPAVPEPGYWVGCELTNCSSQTSCTTCTCVDGDDGGVWQCASNEGFPPETDAAVTPYCALNSGPLDADVPDVGPVEQCTLQYPTCTGPYPESPGWQCCRVSSVGGVTEIQCMPNDAGAYSTASEHP